VGAVSHHYDCDVGAVQVSGKAGGIMTLGLTLKV
jgi:hypothetical protein